MRRCLLGVVLSSAVWVGASWAQRVVRPFPKEVFSAKTVAGVNHSRDEAGTECATELQGVLASAR